VESRAVVLEADVESRAVVLEADVEEEEVVEVVERSETVIFKSTRTPTLSNFLATKPYRALY
jgi:hypothetical protein